MSDYSVPQIYSCPMHPDERSDKPGRCKKCGMAFVSNKELPKRQSIDDTGLGALTWRSYLPLIVIFLILFSVTLVLTFNDWNNAVYSLSKTVSYFMAGFFLVFAGFKLMDLKGFAEGYFTYDLLAKRFFTYGYIYPFIELAFGLVMIAGFHPDWLLWSEFLIMAFSGMGVSIKLYKKEQFQCACLGTFLKVPLTYVTLIEDFGMAILALLLIVIT